MHMCESYGHATQHGKLSYNMFLLEMTFFDPCDPKWLQIDTRHHYVGWGSYGDDYAFSFMVMQYNMDEL